jgi:hypothetical protein
MKFSSGSDIRGVAGWIWNVGLIVLALLTIFMSARRHAKESDADVASVCTGFEPGAEQAAVHKCIEEMKK